MPIVLLTDFGDADGYAGILHGVIDGIAPTVRVIDLAHHLPPFDIERANLVLYRACPYFPKGSIFVVVVDPGVGSSRKPILVETESQYFVGPDNGVFTLALSDKKVKRVIHLNNKEFFLKDVSATFHGRDIFAPIAAHLSRNTSVDEFGPALNDYYQLPGIFPKVFPDHVMGKIIGEDRFGNAITNLKRSLLEKHFPNLNFTLETHTKQRITFLIQQVHSHYAEGKKGEAIMLFGSSGLLEISVNQGSAVDQFNLKMGDSVKIL